MNASSLWAVVFAEMRSCRRLARTWVFVAIALIAVSVTWLWYSLGHTFVSYVSPFAGLVGPHFIVSNLSSTIMLLFSIGIIFLAFDVRSRDLRDRIQDTIDTCPISNFELLLGRLLGVVLILAVPAASMILVLWTLGFVAEAVDFRFGAASEPISVLAFLVWDIVPNLLLWGALTIFFAVFVRYRLLVVVIVGGLLLAYFSLSDRIPFFLASALSTYTGADAYPSALAPQFFNLDIFLNRACILLFAGGLLGVVSTFLPRQSPEGKNIRLLTGGTVSVALSIIGIVGLVQAKLGEFRQADTWAEYHAQYQSDSQTNIKSVSGRVEIFPGRKIELDLLLELSTSSSSKSGDVWLVSLNPGYRIKTLELNGSPQSDFEFENGLIKLPAQDVGTGTANMRLVAGGVPDPMFAYLDSSLKWTEMDYLQARGAFRFGTKSYIFHPQFVALMPGVSWFPASGSSFGASNWNVRPQDFFDLDIEVSVPRNWTLAGPGTRELVDQSKRTTYRFNPRNPIPELALVGSVFERHSISVEDIEFELLISKKHASNLESLKGVVPALKEWLGETLGTARDLGMKYPYGTLSFVEVPVSMRVYGGGWRMDSVFAPPGIQMLRESGFPIARFDYPIEVRSDDFNDDPEVLSKYVLDLLKTYFRNDFDGGNPFVHLGTKYIGHQTLPEGRGAFAMDFLVTELANSLLTSEDGYFSVQTALSGDVLTQVSNSTINSGGGFGSSASIDNLNWRGKFSRKPSVWELMIESPLSELDFEGNPMDTYHVLLLKSSEISAQILEFAGEEKIGAFLSELVSRYRGESYDEDDLLETASDVGLDLDSILGDWLHSVGLPGFIVAEPRVERLADSSNGELIYQTSFVIRNDETAPGVVGVSYIDDLSSEELKLETLRIDGLTSLRIAFQNSIPPTMVVFEPYLSLNREVFQLNIPRKDDYEISDVPILPYRTKSEWAPAFDFNVIVIDDLDDGFSSTGLSDESEETAVDPLIPKWLAFVLSMDSTPLEFDQGMPQLSHALRTLSDNPFDTGQWYRDSEPTSYGKYRHTHAINFVRSDSVQAKFTAKIPTSGKWQLELHIPAAVKRKQYRSTYSPNPGSISTWSRSISLSNLKIALTSDGNSKSIEFDAQHSLDGWNDLGIHEVEAGITEVILTPTTYGPSIGDAVRWSLVEE